MTVETITRSLEQPLSLGSVLDWLREQDPGRLQPLWQAADSVRHRHVGDAVHLRGLVEISNHCRRGCHYCGIRAGNTALPRYRMTADEILGCARRAVELGFGTLVLQSGEDPGVEAEGLAEVIRRIKGDTGLAVTLSLGERTPAELECWRRAGADRYLLRFETGDEALFGAIHPGLDGTPAALESRLGLQRVLRTLGYETGSGVLIGIPGQSWTSLAVDLVLFGELDLDMIGCGPYIPHPDTPLGRCGNGLLPQDQVPGDELTSCKVLALSRLICPEANIPATTAMHVVAAGAGLPRGLGCGANVLMPCLTPPEYRRNYDIYPHKADAVFFGESHAELLAALHEAGRPPGRGAGSRLRSLENQPLQ